MEEFLGAGAHALGLLFTGDPDLWTLLQASLAVSLRAIVIAAPAGVVFAFILAHNRFPGRRLVVSILHSLLALPALMVGTLLYILFSSNGSLQDLQLLFSRTAMVFGQAILAFPIVAAMTYAALKDMNTAAWETARTLGASRSRAMLSVLHDVRNALIAAILTAFGRVVAEVGCAIVIGGNILNHTRTVTTAMALEIHRGDFARALALGFALLILAFGLSVGLHVLHERLTHD